MIGLTINKEEDLDLGNGKPMKSKYKSTFTIFADINGKGVELGLLVIPDGDWYLVQLDGVTLTKIERIPEPVIHWCQLEGTLDQNAIDKVGQAIERKLCEEEADIAGRSTKD